MDGTTPDDDTTESDNDSSDSGILSSILDGFNRLAEKIAALPSSIAEKVIEGIKGIFIPEDGYLESKVEYLREQFVAMGIQPYDMSAIMGKETPLSDVEGTMYGKKVTFVDMDIVDRVLVKFRPVIRGFLYLMMVLYNYNQFMGLIGQQSLTLGGMISTYINGNKEEPWANEGRSLYDKWLGGI